MRILLVEDHKRLSRLVAEGLNAAQFDVDVVGTASEAEELLSFGCHDAMVLDLGLPDMDGIQFLEKLRGKDRSLPVLILTSRIQVSDRVEGLDAGADDYLTKPFAMEELVSRIRALLRRPQDALGQVLEAANTTFDVVSREVRVDGTLLPISPTETRMLEHLLRRCGKVVPKRLLEQGLYGIEEELSSNSVEVLMHRLRKKLGDAGAKAKIHTVRGVGYMILPHGD